MKIKHLPKQIQKKVFEKQIEQGNKPNKNLRISEGRHDGNFHWIDTDEGNDFWYKVSLKDYDHFYEKYSKEKTPNWLKLLAIISIVFITYILVEVLIEFIN
jgi:hypothetical protein